MDEHRTSAPTKDSFGEHLRREREMRGVTLDEITAATRIGTRYLEAFESEQWDRLPGGVFNRGFVRSIAHYLGLDEENLLAEYTLATRGLPRPASWTVQARPRGRERNLGPWLVVAVLAILVAAGGWFGWRHYRAWKRGRVAAAASIQASSQSANALVPTSDASGPTSEPASLDSQGNPTGPDSPSADPTASGGSTAASATDPSGPLTLKVEAVQSTSMRVIADGKRIFDGKIEAGSSQTFQASGEFQISAGDAGALLLELNGQTLPPIGPPGEAGKITLSHETLAQSAGDAH